MTQPSLSVAVAGLGAVGRELAARLDAGIEGLRLSAVSARNVDRARALVRDFRDPPSVLRAGELAEAADVVVECLPLSAFDEVAVPAVEAGRIFVPISVGALLSRPRLIERAHATGARIRVPSGALLGLDAVRACAESTIHSVRMVTRKPPAGLAGAPYLEEAGISLEGLSEPRRVFKGSAREGAAGFPANLNVAAALSLAGVGPDRTELEIWADPTIERNMHTITVEADCARLSMTIENVPSEENPRTGRITPLSVVATLRGLTAPLYAGA